MDLSTMPALPPELRRALALAEPRFTGEHRIMVPLVDVDFRDASGTGDGSFTLTGTPVVYNTVTTLYSGKHWTLAEQIAPGALTKVLAAVPPPLVHLNHGHDMKTAMARLTSVGPGGDVRVGGMKLWEEADGLRVFARLNPELSHARDLSVQMGDGIIDQMSFAFRIGRESVQTTIDNENDHETDLWTIEEVSELFDVCVCAQGAYSTTSAQMRGAIAALSHAGLDPAGIRPRHVGSDPAGGEEAVTLFAGGRVQHLEAQKASAVEARRRERERALALHPLETT